MGLIDEVRRKRDSWSKRFEEHRQDEEYDFEHEHINAEKVEQEIERNKKMVGVFPKKENQ